MFHQQLHATHAIESCYEYTNGTAPDFCGSAPAKCQGRGLLYRFRSPVSPEWLPRYPGQRHFTRKRKVEFGGEKDEQREAGGML
jgi:hypothetical protein